MNSYAWKWNVKADPQKVGTELEAIYEENGKVTPQLIVEDARNPQRETHGLIEWDDATAAEGYRLEQARYITRNIIVVRSEPAAEKEEEKVIKFRAFENVMVDKEQFFMPMREAVSRPDTRNYMLDQAMRALASFRQKYGMIKELVAVMDAIDSIEKTYKQAA